MSKFIVDHNEKLEALSYSQMAVFLRCRRQWEYLYRDRVVPQRDHPSLTIGSLAHQGMAAYWLAHWENGNEPVDPGVGEVAIREAVEGQDILMEGDDFDVFGELVETAIEVYRRALAKFRPERWVVVAIGGRPAVEIRFAIPLVRGVPMQGYIDLVAEDREAGGVWQIDWKFVSTLSDRDDELYNLQSVIYQWALLRMGVSTVGSLTFRAINSRSSTPKVNKNGTISRAAIRISWPEYAKFCLDNSQDPENYRAEMEPKLSEIIWTREAREYRSETTLRELWESEIRGTAHEILKQQTRYPRTISPMTCRSCAYQSLCHGELRGYDVEGIRAMEYKNKGE